MTGARRPVVVVVGDVLLDVDLEGRAGRLSPEDPAPVVDGIVEHERPGGAGLAAVLAAAGADVVLAAPLGDDAPGRRAAALLQDRVQLLPTGTTGATVSKTRVRAGGRTLVRLDRPAAAPQVHVDRAAAAALDAALARADAVLVADYGLGLTRDPLVRAVLASAAQEVPLVWDPHPRGADPVPGAVLATPNHGEAQTLAALPGDDLPDAIAQARALARRWSAQYVLVTRGSGPAVLGTAAGSALVVPVDAAHVPDTCGAGDALAAFATVALAGGAGPGEAAVAGVRGAGAFLRDGGVAGILGRSTGTAAPRRTSAGLTDPAQAQELIATVRSSGGTVVMAGGCFDLLHAGHVAYLEAARALGDCLVVAMNSDVGVRRLKGADRPVVPAPDRAQVLAGLGCVDAVVEFDEPTPALLLRRLRPDVFAKGGDYLASGIPEAPVVTEYGGSVVTLPLLPGRSSTGLLRAARGTGPATPDGTSLPARPADDPQEAACPPTVPLPAEPAAHRCVSLSSSTSREAPPVSAES